MTKQRDTMTPEYDIPIPDDYRDGTALRLAKGLKPGGSYLLETRNKAVSIGNALRRLGHKTVIRKEADKKSGKLLGFRVWRES